MRISSLLPTNQKEAVSCQSVCELLGLTERQLRMQIRKERREGEPILTKHGGGGLWLWNGEDPEEFDRFGYKALTSKGVDLLLTAQLMKERCSIAKR